MNINLKLKKRRERIIKLNKLKKQKALKQLKKDINLNSDENPDEIIKEKIKKFEKFENKNSIFEKNEKDVNKKENNKYDKGNKPIINNFENNNKKNFNFLNKKRYNKETIEKQKKEKKIKKKSIYKNLHKTNKFGQPIMKYQIINILQKIKKKKSSGLI